MTEYKLSDDALVREDREEPLVFKSSSGRLYQINETVLRVLQTLEDGERGIDEIKAALDDEYGLDDEADGVVERATEAALERDLVERTGEG